MSLHIVGTHNSSQLLDQLMNCVYERKEGGTYNPGHTDMDGPNQEGPRGLVRYPHLLPSLVQTVASMKLDARSKGLASEGP